MLHLLLLLAQADDKAAEDALDRFRQAYRNPSAPARAAAVSELGRTPHERTMVQLVGVLSGEVPDVKAAAARTLGHFGEHKRKVVPILLASLAPNAKEDEVQVAIFEALGKLDDLGSLRVVHRYFEDKSGKVAAAALAAAGEIRDISSIELVLKEMEECEKINKQSSGGGGPGVPGGGSDPRKDRAKVVLPAAIKAMQALSKEKWTTPEEWRIWWSRRRATFKIEE